MSSFRIFCLPDSFAPHYKFMSVIILLIITSILVGGGFLCAFIWSVSSGQLDDSETPSIRILFDDENDRRS